MEQGNGEHKPKVRLNSFRVTNFRSFREAEIRVEQDITVIVGCNDAGKSTLLNALWLYGQVCESGFRVVASVLELADDAEYPTFVAEWLDEASGLTYEHTLVCHPRRQEERLAWAGGAVAWDPRQRRLQWGGDGCDAKGIRRLASLGSVPATTWQTDTDVPESIVDRVTTVRSFQTPLPYLFEPSRLALGVPLDIDSVSRNGAGWVMLLQDVVNRRDDSLEKLEKTLGGPDLFPFFRRVGVVEQRYEVTKKLVGMDEEAPGMPTAWTQDDERFLLWSAQRQSERQLRFEVDVHGGGLFPNRTWVPASAMSSGLLLALAYFTVAMAAPEGSLLALEEPENGLNQVVTSQMMEKFLELVRERRHQLLMTTHNGFWLDYVGPQAVRVVTRDEYGSHVFADPDNFERIRDEGLYLSEVMNLGGPEQLLKKRRGGGDEQVAAGR